MSEISVLRVNDEQTTGYTAEEYKEIAATILQQLSVKYNGWPLLAQIGAQRGSFRMLSKGDKEGRDGGLQFDIGKPTSGLKANRVRVWYLPGHDLYSVEFWHIGRKALDVSMTKSEEALDVEQTYGYIARSLMAGCSL